MQPAVGNQDMLTHNHLKQILPQAYPFLLLDRVIEYTKGESLTAIKNITANEWFFQDARNAPNKTNHFPETLLIEAAAQAALVFSYRLESETERYYVGAE